MLSVAVLGPRGNLGKELVKWGCAPVDCEFNDPNDLRFAIYNTQAHTIINCVAYTKVDKAETEDGYQEALQTNFKSVANLGEICLERNKRLIHLSTDYVFNGGLGPYTERERPIRPVNNYGWSKLGGEMALRIFRNPNFCIVRTTGLYGGHKHDFRKLVLEYLGKERTLVTTSELCGNQTYIPHLAEALIELAQREEFPDKVIHIASREVISRYEFAVMIAKAYDLPDECLVHTFNSNIPGWVAPRPTNGGLDTRMAEAFGLPIYSIADGVGLDG